MEGPAELEGYMIISRWKEGNENTLVWAVYVAALLRTTGMK